MMAVACGLIVSSCASKKDLENCQTENKSLTSDLKNVLRSVLKDRELKIVCECFGIGCQERGLEEIGAEMGLTRERVRQIREKSITKLHDSGHARILMKYLG